LEVRKLEDWDAYRAWSWDEPKQQPTNDLQLTLAQPTAKLPTDN
jgi:hypothetical protein